MALTATGRASQRRTRRPLGIRRSSDAGGCCHGDNDEMVGMLLHDDQRKGVGKKSQSRTIFSVSACLSSRST